MATKLLDEIPGKTGEVGPPRALGPLHSSVIRAKRSTGSRSARLCRRQLPLKDAMKVGKNTVGSKVLTPRCFSWIGVLATTKQP